MVEAVAVELGTAFGKDVDDIAATETQLDTGADGEHPLVLAQAAAVIRHVVVLASVFPGESAAETYERHNGEDAFGIYLERVEHVPHKVEVAAYVVEFVEVAVLEVNGTALEAQTPAQIGRHPFTEGKIVRGCDGVCVTSLGIPVLAHEHVDTGAELDEPVAVAVRVIIGVAGNVDDIDNRDLFYNNFVLSRSLVGGEKHAQACAEKQ